MVTLKLKKTGSPDRPATRSDRAPVRGIGAGASKPRPTLAEAEAQRAEREARYQEQLRQRFGDQPPAKFARRDDQGPGPGPGRSRQDGPPQRRDGPPRGDDRRPPQRGDDRRPPARGEDRGPGARGDAPRFAPRQDERGPAFRQDQRRATSARNDSRPPQGETRYAPRDDARPPRHREDGPPQRARRDAPAPGQNTAFGRPAAPQAARPNAGPKGRDDHRDDRSPAPVRRREAAAPDTDASGTMRLSKRMSELGIASRREADEWIPKGWVRVDGRVVTELGSRVLPGQHITIDAKARNQQSARVTVLINKPVGYVSGQAEDGYEPAYVLVTPDNQWREDHSGIRFQMSHLRNLAPAGRLDIDSVGLLVLTQDGRVAKQLIGEDSEVEKEYLVRVRTVSGDALPQASLARLRHGLSLDGVQLQPAIVEWVNDDQLRFVLREGRKRQIRRMCEAVGLDVLGLKRVRIGTVMLGDLPPGQWRYLRYDERFAELQAGAAAAAAAAAAAGDDADDGDTDDGDAEDLVDDPDEASGDHADGDDGDMDAEIDAADEAHGDEGDGREA